MKKILTIKISILIFLFSLNTTIVFSATTYNANCSQVVLKNGDVLQADILSMTDCDITYKRCGKPNDPETKIFKSNILKIKDGDGEVLYDSKNYACIENQQLNIGNDNKKPTGNIQSNDDNNKDKNSTDSPKTNTNTSIAYVLGLLGAIAVWVAPALAVLLLIGAIIFGLVGISKTNKEPNKYKKDQWALLNVIIDFILLLVLFL